MKVYSIHVLRVFSLVIFLISLQSIAYGQLQLSIGSASAYPFDYLDVPVTVSNYSNIGGGSGSIVYDASYFQFVGITQINGSVQGLDTGVSSPSSGVVAFRFNSGSGISLADGSVLFSIRLTVKYGYLGNTAFSFADNPYARRFYDAGLASVPTSFIAGNVTINNPQITLSGLQSGSSYCAGQNITFGFTHTAGFQHSDFFDVSISDSSGDFTNTIRIGIYI